MWLLLLLLVPRFEDYAVTERYEGKAATPVLATKQDRLYRTRLRDAAQGKPDFAGHYIVSVFGCGASCVMGAVIDAKTGRVTWFPFTICCSTVPVDQYEPVRYKLSSRLVVFQGMRNEDGHEGTYYYKFDAGRFIPIQ